MLLTLFNLNLELPASRKSTKNGHDNNQCDLVPSSHLNRQVRLWGGAQNGQNLKVLYKEIIFNEQWQLIP